MEYIKKLDDYVRPFAQPAMFGYLAYFYMDVSQNSFAASNELSALTLGNIVRYALVLAMLAFGIAAAGLIAKLFDWNAGKDPSEHFSEKLRVSLNPLLMASAFQLLSIYVIGHSLNLTEFDTNMSVAAGVVTLVAVMTSYANPADSADGSLSTAQVEKATKIADKAKNMLVKALEFVVGADRTYSQLATTISGGLVLTAWIYTLSNGAFVGPWYEAFTIMLLTVLASVGLVVKSSDNAVSNMMRRNTMVVLHVFMIYFLSKYVGAQQTGHSLVALGLVIASGVITLSSHAADSGDGNRDRLNARLNNIASSIMNIVHIGVAVLALLAENDMTTEDDVLRSIITVGAILKIAGSFTAVSQAELVLRNSSTLLLLLPFAALYDSDMGGLQWAASIAVLAARAADALQNTLVQKTGNILDNLGENMIENLSALPPAGTFDNPIVYVVVAFLLSTSVTLVMAGGEACPVDGILSPSGACPMLSGNLPTYLRLTIALTWMHAAIAFVGTMAKYFESSNANTLTTTSGWISASTLELVRVTVSTLVLGYLSYVVQSSTEGTDGNNDYSRYAHLSLLFYIFVDILGRNVV